MKIYVRLWIMWKKDFFFLISPIVEKVIYSKAFCLTLIKGNYQNEIKEPKHYIFSAFNAIFRKTVKPNLIKDKNLCPRTPFDESLSTKSLKIVHQPTQFWLIDLAHLIKIERFFDNAHCCASVAISYRQFHLMSVTQKASGWILWQEDCYGR